MKLQPGFWILILHLIAISAAITWRWGAWVGFWVLVFSLGAVLVMFVLSLCWAASGECDVNGDVERDAGLPWPAQKPSPRAPARETGSAGSAAFARNGQPSTTHN